MRESSDKEWHGLSVEETASSLGVSPRGWAAEEVRARQSRFGANEIVHRGGRGIWRLAAAQFTDIMILLLIAAAGVSAVVGDWQDAAVILAILGVNAGIGFFQEYRSERAMEALRGRLEPIARVLRGGEIRTVRAAELVPGDRVYLEAGAKVPADLRLTEAAALRIDESILTGESLPTDKMTEAIRGGAAALGDRVNMAYGGTLVTAGRGEGLVTATGLRTEFGKIAESIQRTLSPPTPLQKRLAHLGRALSFAVAGICAVIFGVGIARGEEPLLMFMTAVSLAVAAIPEAMPAVVTVSLALGARRMVRQNALVRKLSAVEALGSVTTICADKTGTLTVNRMRVESLSVGGPERRDPEGEAPWQKLLEAMTLCNDAVKDADGIRGDPTETALWEAAAKWGRADVKEKYPRIAEIPFDYRRRRMTTVHREISGSYAAFCKGAVEEILSRCSLRFHANGAGDLDREAVRSIAAAMAARGLRVLAFATRSWRETPPQDAERLEEDLVFLGFIGLMDPLREGAREAVKSCRAAGITPVMITGDHPGTAKAAALELGIYEEDDALVTGEELHRMSPQEFKGRVRGIRVYARVSPEEKLKIVTALQDAGEVVAMTGDGVNDAPALKKSDVGVVMGSTGTDVAREASSLVLLDDCFATIVAAVREGRRIYDNLRRFVRYALTTNCAEVWIVFLAPFLGLPLPFLPIQILWINLLTDGLPGLALAVEPGEKNLMTRGPRSVQEDFFARGLGWHVVWMGLWMASLVLGAQVYLIRGGAEHWQSFILTLLCFCQLAHAFAVRSETESIFSYGIFSNRALFGSVGITLACLLATLYAPPLQRVFRTSPLTATELAVAAGLSLLVVAAVEVEKVLRRSSSPS